MRALKNFAKSKKNDFKVIIMFNSVSDSLYNNTEHDILRNNVKNQKSEFADQML